ncbi:MAG: CinA family nicotinamide mononucleotide deamidase-related protein [Longilinea sp.]|nr:CinA family nicotinamide mononucleotide deamidase-related protein [Longilinea sp.]MCA1954272.1 CinA family nicotinamide mononucleotide deamidase-related protein [Anaerolinea sp.]
MPSAEIIAIGTELLLGEIQDTNTRHLARALRDLGIDLYRATLIGDNANRIAQVIQEAMQRSPIVITTGGLGPTVDDPTREAVAQAINRPIEFRPELWEQVQQRFLRFHRQPTENNRRQAFIPQGATPIENPVGTAPAFYYDDGEHVIISLPGVPREMEYLLEHAVAPFLRRRFHLHDIIATTVLHTAGIGESQVDQWVADLETLTNPTVGLSAHAGIIDIRLTAKASSAAEAQLLLTELSDQIRQRLGNHIFGQDEQTLAAVINAALASQQASAALLFCGLELPNAIPLPTAQLHLRPTPLAAEALQSEMRLLQGQTGSPFVLAASYFPGEWQQTLLLSLSTPTGEQSDQRSYGGPAALGPTWALHTALDFLRRGLLFHS